LNTQGAYDPRRKASLADRIDEHATTTLVLCSVVLGLVLLWLLAVRLLPLSWLEATVFPVTDFLMRGSGSSIVPSIIGLCTLLFLPSLGWRLYRRRTRASRQAAGGAVVQSQKAFSARYSQSQKWVEDLVPGDRVGSLHPGGMSLPSPGDIVRSWSTVRAVRDIGKGQFVVEMDRPDGRSVSEVLSRSGLMTVIVENDEGKEGREEA
jgi:hypothetical protein